MPAPRSSWFAPWRSRRAVWCLALGVLGVWLAWVPFGFDLEERLGLPLLFALRGERPPPGGVVIVGMDRRSSARAGWPAKPESWPRSRHAELIRGLSRACARLVVYDVFFAAEGDSEQDRLLADALREAGNVILVSHLGIADEAPAPLSPGAWQVERKPATGFAQAAAAVAPFPLPGSAGGVNGYWLFKPDAGDLPSLPAVALLAHAEGGARREESAGPPNRGYRERLRRIRRRFGEGGPPEGPEPLRRLSESPDFVYFNWFGPPRTIPTVDFPSALARLAGTSRCAAPFAGNTVFVGMAETSPVEQKDRDTFDTPFTTEAGARLSGVELAATAFANLRDGDAIRRAGEFAQLLPILVWGVAAALLWTALAPAAAAGLSLAAATAYGALVQWQFAAHQLWLPWVIPGLQLLAAAGGGMALQRQRLQQRLQGLRRALADWLPEDVVAEIVADPGIRRRATGLVHGTCMAVRVPAPDTDGSDPLLLGGRLRDTLRAVDRVLACHRGAVAEQTRYGRLAVWVAAGPDGELRRQACLAGLALQPGQGGSDARPLRAGLHTGRIAVDCLQGGGGELRRSFGAVVDAAERIGALNQTLGTSVLASAETLLGMAGFHLRPLGRFVFPDLAEPLELAEIRGRRGEGDDAGQAWLCERFAAALEAYRQADWEACSAGLLAVLGRVPDDGPSHFFLRRCEYFRRHPPIAAWDPLVRL